MNKLINNFKAFYKANRLLIIGGLAFILLMQICSRGGRVKSIQPRVEDIQMQSEDTDLKSLDEIYAEDMLIKKPNNPELTSVLLLVGLVLLFYVATKRGWVQKLAPAFVWVSIHIKRHPHSKERIATIEVLNQTKESVTFIAPIISFSNLVKKSRKFRIKSGSGYDVFPLTLAPGTRHKISINIDVFKQKAGVLKSFKWVRVEVNANNNRKYSSIWKFLF